MATRYCISNGKVILVFRLKITSPVHRAAVLLSIFQLGNTLARRSAPFREKPQLVLKIPPTYVNRTLGPKTREKSLDKIEKMINK
jgi:hypothetical protein